LTGSGTEGPTNPSEVPVVAPEPAIRVAKRQPRRWLPWAVIAVAVAVALGIVLPLTLGSSATAVPTPTSPTTAANTLKGLSGTYYSPTVQDSSLLFLRLVQLQSTLSGVLTVTRASASRDRLVARHYQISGKVEGPSFDVTIGPGTRTVGGTYVAGVLSIVLADGTRVSLHHGTLTTYRTLVAHDKALLLS
jgi:hypothetical protein